MNNEQKIFTIPSDLMQANFISFNQGSSVVYQTNAVWHNITSACFFRVIKLPENRFLIESVVEIPTDDSHKNRPHVDIQQIARKNNLEEAITLCEQSYSDFIENQTCSIISESEFPDEPWEGEELHLTTPITIANDNPFASSVRWMVTIVTPHQYHIYLLGFSDASDSYQWIEFIDAFQTDKVAIEHAEEYSKNLSLIYARTIESSDTLSEKS